MKLNTGKVVIPIERDGENVGNLEFDPQSVPFVTKYYDLVNAFENIHREYSAEIKKLQSDKEVDIFGIPKNTGKSLELLRKLCDFMDQQIDLLFGEGTCRRVFGGHQVPEMYIIFLGEISPHVEKARLGAVGKYVSGNKGVLQ